MFVELSNRCAEIEFFSWSSWACVQLSAFSCTSCGGGNVWRICIKIIGHRQIS